MKKDQHTILGEFIRSLSEDDLRLVASRLIDRYSGDLSEALNFLSKHKRIDGVFRAAKTAEDLYDLIDMVQGLTQRECDRRNVSTSKFKVEAA